MTPSPRTEAAAAPPAPLPVSGKGLKLGGAAPWLRGLRNHAQRSGRLPRCGARLAPSNRGRRLPQQPFSQEGSGLQPLPLERDLPLRSRRGVEGRLMGGGAFDEMNGHPNGADPPSEPPTTASSAWLDATPADVFDTRRSQAELFFRRIGITFAVYGDNESTERLIPFDIIPRVLTKPEWTTHRARPEAAGERAQRLPRRRLRPAGMHQGRRHPGRPRLPQPALPAGDDRLPRAARGLRPHRRHRHRAGRRRHLLRAGGQCPHALRRLLHAGEPRGDDAALPRAVHAPPRRAGRELSRTRCSPPCARSRRRGRAGTRPSCC